MPLLCSLHKQKYRTLSGINPVGYKIDLDQARQSVRCVSNTFLQPFFFFFLCFRTDERLKQLDMNRSILYMSAVGAT